MAESLNTSQEIKIKRGSTDRLRGVPENLNREQRVSVGKIDWNPRNKSSRVGRERVAKVRARANKVQSCLGYKARSCKYEEKGNQSMVSKVEADNLVEGTSGVHQTLEEGVDRAIVKLELKLSSGAETKLIHLLEVANLGTPMRHIRGTEVNVFPSPIIEQQHTKEYAKLLKNGKSLVELVRDPSTSIPCIRISMVELDNLRVKLNKVNPEINYHSVEEEFDGEVISVPLYGCSDIPEISKLIEQWHFTYVFDRAEAEEAKDEGRKTLRELLKVLRLDKVVTVEEGKQLGLVLKGELAGHYPKVTVWRRGTKMEVCAYPKVDHEKILGIISEWYYVSKHRTGNNIGCQCQNEGKDEVLTLDDIFETLGDRMLKWSDRMKGEFEKLLRSFHRSLIKGVVQTIDGAVKNVYHIESYGAVCLLAGSYSMPL
jgi:hypothetical protein